MSFQDSAVIFFIALLLFGPKKLPELARQLGKLMGEFRRASNEFRMQMEDELRLSEQAERQKQIAALEAAAPPAAADATPALSAGEELAPHPHAALSAPAPAPDASLVNAVEIPEHSIASHSASEAVAPPPPDRTRADDSAPPVIATSGDLTMRPPASGLPVSRNGASVADAFATVPQAPSSSPDPDREAASHG